MPSSKMAVGALTLGACGLAGQAFLAGPRGAAEVATQPALRGFVGKEPALQGSDRIGAPSAVLAAAGVATLGALSAGRRGGPERVPRASQVTCNFSKETQIGAQAPLGFFDPLGFCTDEETFKDLRAKEIKHGRLAMMGALGMLTQSVVQLPGMEGVPTDVTACTVGNGQVGFALTLALIAGLEAAVFVQDPTKEPGNFGNPVPWFDDYSDEMRAREINNGRIAMFSAIGIISASLYTGKPAIEQFGL